MSEANESIKDKIRKLLAKADDTSVTVEEAQLFNNKAHELMERYNLDRAMLGTGKAKEAVRTHLTFTTMIRPYSSAIIQGITKLYYCKAFFSSLDRKGRKHEVTLIGEEHNVAVCKAICIMAIRAVEAEARSTGLGRSFMTGAGHRIYQRCLEMYQGTHGLVTKAAPTLQLTKDQSTALVVHSQSETQGNNEYVETVLKIRLGKARSSKPKVRDAGGYHAGQRFGDTVNLRSNLIGR